MRYQGQFLSQIKRDEHKSKMEIIELEEIILRATLVFMLLCRASHTDRWGAISSRAFVCFKGNLGRR